MKFASIERQLCAHSMAGCHRADSGLLLHVSACIESARCGKGIRESAPNALAANNATIGSTDSAARKSTWGSRVRTCRINHTLHAARTWKIKKLPSHNRGSFVCVSVRGRAFGAVCGLHVREIFAHRRTPANVARHNQYACTCVCVVRHCTISHTCTLTHTHEQTYTTHEHILV